MQTSYKPRRGYRNKKKRIKQSRFRKKLHINEEEWTWRDGKGNYILIEDPHDHKIHKIDWINLPLSEEDIDRINTYCCYCCSGSLDIEITPAIVKEYIEKNLV